MIMWFISIIGFIFFLIFVVGVVEYGSVDVIMVLIIVSMLFDVDELGVDVVVVVFVGVVI